MELWINKETETNNKESYGSERVAISG